MTTHFRLGFAIAALAITLMSGGFAASIVSATAPANTIVSSSVA